MMGRVNDVLSSGQPESLFVWRFVCALYSSKSEGSNREVMIGSCCVGAVQRGLPSHTGVPCGSMGLCEPIAWSCRKCHSFTLGMGLNNTSQQTALTFRTPGPPSGNCNFHHHGGRIRTLGTGGAYEGGPRTASVAKCATTVQIGVAGQFDGNGHQSCIVEQIGKQMLRIWRNPRSPQEEKERARHVTWNAWWQHFDVLTRHHFRANHTIPEQEPWNQPELTWELH